MPDTSWERFEQEFVNRLSVGARRLYELQKAEHATRVDNTIHELHNDDEEGLD